MKHINIPGARDSSVGIATAYGLDGPGIETRWETRLSAPVQTGPEAHPVSYTMGTGSFPAVNRPGGASAEVEGRVQLYICFPSGPSWPVIGWTLPLPLPLPFTFTFTLYLYLYPLPLPFTFTLYPLPLPLPFTFTHKYTTWAKCRFAVVKAREVLAYNVIVL